MMQWIQSSKKVWINRETADAWQHICYSDEKKESSLTGFHSYICFPCLPLFSPITTDRLGIWKTNKQKQTDEEFFFFFQFCDWWWVLIFSRIRCYLHKMHSLGKIKMLSVTTTFSFCQMSEKGGRPLIMLESCSIQILNKTVADRHITENFFFFK